MQVCQHEQEQAMLKERARKLERRLGTLDSEYTQQMDNLRAAYHKTLSSTLDRDLQGEENVRQRYQAEIEHLRVCDELLMCKYNLKNSPFHVILFLFHRKRNFNLDNELSLSKSYGIIYIFPRTKPLHT